MKQAETQPLELSWWDSLTARSEFMRDRVVPILRYMRRNRLIVFGLGAFVALTLFVGLSYLFYEQEDLLQERQGVNGLVKAASVQANQKPSWNPWSGYPLGTDVQGRDIYAAVVVGIPLSLRIGVIAAAIGVGVGMVLAFVAAYVGGVIDAVVRTVVDSLIPIPGLLVLVLVATSLNPGKGLTVDQLAFVIAVLAWPGPARVIRSQVLVIRERGYVEMARMSGTSAMGIIFKEMMPNLAPYALASFVAAVSGSILASIGVESLGLGTARLTDAGEHDLLEHLHEFSAFGFVVLAVAADFGFGSAVRRTVHDFGRLGRGSKSAVATAGLGDETPTAFLSF